MMPTRSATVGPTGIRTAAWASIGCQARARFTYSGSVAMAATLASTVSTIESATLARDR